MDANKHYANLHYGLKKIAHRIQENAHDLFSGKQAHNGPLKTIIQLACKEQYHAFLKELEKSTKPH